MAQEWVDFFRRLGNAFGVEHILIQLRNEAMVSPLALHGNDNDPLKNSFGAM